MGNANRPRLTNGLFILGVISLSYLLGAAVMYFRWPTSDFLTNAFLGAEIWKRKVNSTGSVPEVGAAKEESVWVGHGEIDKKDKTCNGYTLCAVAPGNEAYLINMNGDVVHKWTLSFKDIWPKAPQLDRLIPYRYICLFDLHPYPNGDLLVVFHCYGGATEGCGLAKVDKDSKVLWTYDKSVHHDVDVDDDGKIYLTTQEVAEKPMPGLEFIPAPTLIDFVEVLSPEGKPLKKVSVLEALRNSPELFSVLKNTARQPDFQGDSRTRGDVLHTNHVEVLRPKLAPKFTLLGWKAGQVLISMRNINAIALLDLETSKFVWGATGIWKAQHDPEFLDNGHILIFDNKGLGAASRVLEFDPKDGTVPWLYPADKGAQFECIERGMSQRLPNGNTFLVNSVGMQLVEVTPDKELVWQYSTGKYTHFARRYAAEDLEFLPSDKAPRR